MEKSMTVFEALRILALVHTRDDCVCGFGIMDGASINRPGDLEAFCFTPAEYAQAWRVVREQLHMQVEPEESEDSMRS